MPGKKEGKVSFYPEEKGREVSFYQVLVEEEGVSLTQAEKEGSLHDVTYFFAWGRGGFVIFILNREGQFLMVKKTSYY